MPKSIILEDFGWILETLRGKVTQDVKIGKTFLLKI